MRFPPGLSSRKLACPSQVRVLAMPVSLAERERLPRRPAGPAAAVGRRNVRREGEAESVRLRLAAPALGAIGLLVSLAGAGGAASLLLLAAIAAASAHLLERVGEVAEEGDGRLPAVVSGLSLALLVAAGATA